jgi:hypothetical protein
MSPVKNLHACLQGATMREPGLHFGQVQRPSSTETIIAGHAACASSARMTLQRQQSRRCATCRRRRLQLLVQGFDLSQLHVQQRSQTFNASAKDLRLAKRLERCAQGRNGGVQHVSIATKYA